MKMNTTQITTPKAHFTFSLPGHFVKIAFMLLMSFALAGCVMLSPPEAGSASTPPLAPAPNAPTPEAVAISEPISATSNLLLALNYAPIETDMLAFTDWTVLKAVAGVEELTSASPMDERLAFVTPLGVSQQALASAFAMNYYLRHAETWGWDITDLLWETSLTLDGPPLYVLRFRDDFDFASALALLDERGYTQLDHGGVTVYSHPLDLTLDWIRTTELAIFNIAYLPEEKIFVLSSGQQGVLDTLDKIAAGETLALRPDVASVAAELGNVGSTIVAPFGCGVLNVLPNLAVSADIRERLLENIQQSGITGLYTTFGIGYRVDEVDGEELPLGVLVMHYLSTEQAEADLEPRRNVAETAQSFSRAIAYSEMFDLVDIAVVPTQGELGELGAANMVMRLHANERSPQIFFSMLYQRDLLFATCGM